MAQSSQPARPQLQASEAALLNELKSSFETLEDSSWVHGSLHDVTKVSIYIKEKDSER
jgi:hypothetical protein